MLHFTRLFFALIIFSTLSTLGYTQTSNYIVVNTYYPNDTVCGLDINLSFSIGEALENLNTTIHNEVINYSGNDSIFNVITSFGDGTPSETGYFMAVSSLTNNILYTPTHHYSQPGTYHIQCLLVSKPQLELIFMSITITVGFCSGDIYTEVLLDCNNDGVPDSTLSEGVPMELIGGNNNIVHLNSTNNPSTIGPIATIDYIPSIDQDWLNQNNYFVHSINSSFNFPVDTLISAVLGCIDNSTYELISLHSSADTVIADQCNSTISMNFYTEIDSPADSSVQIHQIIHGNDFAGFAGEILVDWGDGTTSWSAASSSTFGTPLLSASGWSHTYSLAGTYYIISTVTNAQDSIGISDTLVYTITNCYSNLAIETALDCNNDGIIEYMLLETIPYYLTDNSSTTYPVVNDLGQFSFLDLPFNTYTLQIDSAWLADSGYLFESSAYQVVIDSYSSTPIAINTLLNCNPFEPISACAQGIVYCDSNLNGTFDAGDIPVPNALVTLQNLSTNSALDTVFSASDGTYVFDYSAFPNDSIQLTINQAWIDSSGFTTLEISSQWLLSNLCNSSNETNLGLECNGLIGIPQHYAGVVYCDTNGNGIADGDDEYFLSAPVTLHGTSVNSETVTVLTNILGMFHYTGVLLGDPTYAIASVPGWWLNDNGYTTVNSTNEFILYPSSTPTQIEIDCGNGTSTFEIEESQLTALLIYPNPASNAINIQAKGNFQYYIHNTIGALIQVGSGVDLTTIGLSDYATGVYEISLLSNGEVHKGRFIKI